MPAVFMRYWGGEAEWSLTLKIFASCHQSVSSCVGAIVRGKWRICGGVELQLQAAACADPEAEAASQSSLTLACTPSFLPCTGFTLQPCTKPALHQDYPPAPIQALEYPQCPAPGQLCSESVLCTIRHHVFLALDLPHTRSVLHPAYIYGYQALFVWFSCLLFESKFDPLRLSGTSTSAALSARHCGKFTNNVLWLSRTEFSHPTNSRESSAG